MNFKKWCFVFLAATSFSSHFCFLPFTSTHHHHSPSFHIIFLWQTIGKLFIKKCLLTDGMIEMSLWTNLISNFATKINGFWWDVMAITFMVFFLMVIILLHLNIVARNYKWWRYHRWHGKIFFYVFFSGVGKSFRDMQCFVAHTECLWGSHEFLRIFLNNIKLLRSL